MGMTRKDYELIAEVINDLPEVFNDKVFGFEEETLRDLLSAKFADGLSQEYDNFRSYKFWRACMEGHLDE